MRAAASYPHVGFRARTPAQIQSDCIVSIAADLAALASFCAGIWAAAHAFWSL